MAQHRVQPLARADIELLHLAEGCADLFDTRQEALEQQLFFVRDVIVDRGLGDLERRRDVIQRSIVKALLVEGAGGGADNGFTLDGVVAQTLPAGFPGRGRRGLRSRLAAIVSRS